MRFSRCVVHRYEKYSTDGSDRIFRSVKSRDSNSIIGRYTALLSTGDEMISYFGDGLKWTRTTDLTLIRRAL